MLGMMNCNNDAVEFYAAGPRKTPLSEEEKVFVERKEKKQVTYTEDGRKMIDGKVVESTDESEGPEASPADMWSRLIVGAAAAGRIRKDQPAAGKSAGKKEKSS